MHELNSGLVIDSVYLGSGLNRFHDLLPISREVGQLLGGWDSSITSFVAIKTAETFPRRYQTLVIVHS